MSPTPQLQPPAMSVSKFFFRIINNRIVNRLLISTGLDAFMLSRFGLYRRVKPDTSLSPQEMAGFSHAPDVEEALNKTHHDVQQTALKYIKAGSNVLDIGCGAGAYLVHFEKNYIATGIDLNTSMIAAGPKHVPGAKFIYADFLEYQFDRKFDYIYSISVLEFIPPGRIESFLAKIASLLNPGGVVFLHYPHALSEDALKYPDLFYIEYSPALIDKTAQKYFEIIEHKHAFDGRPVCSYDNNPYNPGVRTFKNGYLLIARKR